MQVKKKGNCCPVLQDYYCSIEGSFLADDQVEQESSSAMHKSESTTMLCDEHPLVESTVHHAADTAATSTAAEDDESKPTTMLCDEVAPHPSADHSKPIPLTTDMTVRDLLLLCQLFYLPAAHGRVSNRRQ